MRLLAKFIYFNLLGWTFKGWFPEVKQCVVVVAPHTSNWDFLLGLLVRSILNIEINYIAKKTLFKPAFGWFFKAMGGIPIDRTKNNDTVSAIAQVFKEREVFRLALSPEGTRKMVNQWKTGFYYIAKEAEVPLVLVAFDYGKKRVTYSETIYTTEDKIADFSNYHTYFKGVTGYNKEQT